MHINYPSGVNPPLPEDRFPILKAVPGTSVAMTTRLYLNSGEPVTPENSRVFLVLSDSIFCASPLIVLEWTKGISEVDSEDHPGLLLFSFPDATIAVLRRGAYPFSIRVENTETDEITIPVQHATLLVDYATAGSNHDIPYKNQDC